jgi:hypothetical protein
MVGFSQVGVVRQSQQILGEVQAWQVTTLPWQSTASPQPMCPWHGSVQAHVSVVVLQNSPARVQFWSARHCWQRPSPSQYCLVESLAAHSTSFMQPRQALFAPQIGEVTTVHWLLCVHWTQAPLVAQAGAPGLTQSALLVQARQVSVAVLQTGVVPEQLPLPVHCTQEPARLPVAAHTGVAGARAWHSSGLRPLVQARQACVLVLQNGVVPEQSVLATQRTQVLLVVSQTGVAVPAQCAFEVQATQAPVAVLHAGAAGLLAAHGASAVHAAQAPPVQMGALPAHCELAVQFTHGPPPQVSLP